jgi:hypothetical protein
VHPTTYSLSTLSAVDAATGRMVELTDGQVLVEVEPDR